MRMMLPRSVLLAAAGLLAQEHIPPALQAMVDTERAFADAATHKGIRDSFLEYFADDAIAFNPGPIPAKDGLRTRAPRAFSEFELRWEPRSGDVAASGELGWLTGPSTFIDHTVPDAHPQPGNYLSIWRRDGDGPWRVLIDLGSQPPAEVTFVPGFERFTFPSRYAGGEPKERAAAALLSDDRRLNAALATDGAAAAYSTMTTGASRLHRKGSMPSIGTAAIQKWMAEHAASMTAKTGAADAARSGDLGYSYGIFEVSAPTRQSGAYVRVWERDATGRWLVVVDVTQ